MEDNDNRMFPGLRRGMMFTFIGIAKFFRYVCYLLCAVFLYLLYQDFNKAKADGVIVAFVVTFLLAIAMFIVEWKFTKNIDKLS